MSDAALFNNEYRQALAQARVDLAEAQTRHVEATARCVEADKHARIVARIVLSLANLLGEEPPIDAVRIFTEKPIRQPTPRSATDRRYVKRAVAAVGAQ